MSDVCRVLARVGAGSVLLLLAACGSTTQTANDPAVSVPATSPGPTAAPSGSTSSGARPTSSTVPPKPGALVLTGTVGEGVEAGCLILSTSQGRYVLVGGGTAGLRAGQTVTVEGVVRKDAVSTCQQGQLLDVTRLLPN